MFVYIPNFFIYRGINFYKKKKKKKKISFFFLN